ncbi:MAG: T9SS type A sorting domain-containing protein [Saprospiraceae bacterium]|nr:T9SS type A sorting domain-containing protein [Saprospiraceae bacterium]
MKKLIIILLAIGFAQTSFSQFTCGDTLVDVRDGKKYPTLQIGSQCWMGANLNVGTMVMAQTNANVQLNNSVIEKFCYNNDSLNCDSLGGLYQWDEMMGYVSTQGIQGICPNGWHLPAVSEWDTLFAQFNPATVAQDLQIGGSSGFNAPAAGYCYHNYSNWIFGSLGSYGVYRTTAASTSMGTNYSTVYYYYPSQGTIGSGSMYKKANGYSVRCIWNGPTTGLNNSKTNAIEIADAYPNPSQADFIIEFKLPENEKFGQILFFDLSGKVVRKVNIERGMNDIKISTDEFRNGVYFYYILTETTNSIVKKLEIIKN